MPLDTYETEPIVPVYRQVQPNDPIELGTHVVRSAVIGGPSAENATADIRMCFVPNVALDLVVPISDQSIVQQLKRAFDAQQSELHEEFELSDRNVEVPVFLKSADSEATTYRVSTTPFQSRPADGPLTHAIFHLFNWPTFSGKDDYVLRGGAGGARLGRLKLAFDDWRVDVAAIAETAESVENLKKSGGYMLTHVGKAYRQNGADFTYVELEQFLEFLTYFFSFALGKWSGPQLTVAFDKHNQSCFEHWGIGRCDGNSWDGGRSWFDDRHSELLSELAPRFWKLWCTETWQDPLRETIYWYINGNRAGAGLGVDSALLFTQAALELLAWNYCVIDRCMISEKAFSPRGLSAADRLRMLLSLLSIPIDIPVPLSALRQRPARKWIDGLDAITNLRNGLVHPGRNQKVHGGEYYEASKLSLWYIELVVLRLSEYKGRYANRLLQRSAGVIHDLPWCVESSH